jgi:hypothetical protein
MATTGLVVYFLAFERRLFGLLLSHIPARRERYYTSRHKSCEARHSHESRNPEKHWIPGQVRNDNPTKTHAVNDLKTFNSLECLMVNDVAIANLVNRVGEEVETSVKSGYDSMILVLTGRTKERRYAQRESKEGIRRCFKIRPG